MSEKTSLADEGKSESDTLHGSQQEQMREVSLDVIEESKETIRKDDDDERSANYLTGRTLFAVFLGLCLALFMSSLDQTVVSVALPVIAFDFNALDQIAWVGTSYMLTSTAFQPMYGKFSDIFGRRSVLLFAIAIFEIGSVLCGAAQSMIMLIIARAVAGIGAGGMMSMVIITISDIVPMRERGKYQGIIGGVFSISSVVGPLLGGVFTDKISWRWAFYINLPIGALAAPAIFFLLKLKTPKASWAEKFSRIDWWGTITLVASIVLLLLPLNWGGSQYAWSSPVIICLFVAAVIMILMVMFVEGKIAKEPIIPGRLFLMRNPAAVFIVNFFTGCAMFGIFFYVPLYFQVIKGESATIAGLETLPLVGGLVLSSIGSGIVTTKTGKYRFFIWIGLLITTAGCTLLSRLETDSGRGVSVGYLFVMGIGLGLCMQTAILAVQAATTHADMASATAVATFWRTIGGVFGIAISGTVFNNQLSSSLPPILQQLSPSDLEKYEHNGATFINTLSGPVVGEFKSAYMDGLKLAFLVMIPFAGMAFLCSLPIEHKTLAKGKKPKPVAME